MGTARNELSVTVPATPYTWPFHGSLDPRRIALVACCDSSWRPARGADDGDSQLARLAGAVAAAAGLVVAVMEVPARRSRFPTADGIRGAGAGEPTPVPVGAGSSVLTVTASGASAFYGSPLDDLLRDRGRTDLLLAGWGLEGPIHSTMRAANDRGYECLLVSDASVAWEPALAFNALEMVRFSGGIFGAFADTDQVVDALHRIPDELEES